MQKTFKQTSGWSNGRTADSESVCGGSNPSPEAIFWDV